MSMSVFHHAARPLKRTLACAALVTAGFGAAGSVQAQSSPTAAVPQYGGALNIVTVWRTISPMSFDQADWTWRFIHDMGLVNESLMAADLSKSTAQGGKFKFIGDAHIPSEAVRGELAESWELLENPRRVVFKLRKGIMYPEKKGVMKAREFVADDVVYSWTRLNSSPKRGATFFDFVDKVEATDKHTVVFTLNKYSAEWDYRLGWGYFASIVPKEVVDAGPTNWRNANGTGPFMLTNYVQGSTLTYRKNKDYWDSVTLGGKPYKLPFVDTINYRIIRDEATALTGLRTGKIDVMEMVPWSAVDELKKTAPQLKWNRWLATLGNYVALRTDTKPFDDVRVRRALNMAIDREQLLKNYFGGNAEMLGYPMHTDFGNYYEGLDTMPAEVKELFTYQPDKAKKLLAEAGYPNGFTVKVQTHATATNADLLAMVVSHLARVGVKMEIEVVEYPAFIAQMTNKTHPPARFMTNGHTNPTNTLLKSFGSGQTWNPSMYSDKSLDAALDKVQQEPDEAKRQAMLRAETRKVLAAAPHIWLPTPYHYTAWWPWVQNYGGELRAGAERPAPIHARMWVDQAMKKKMGF